jgi:isoquinoline 1-oxidoreductase beta subunit
MMQQIANLSRRRMLQGTLAGGLVLGLRVGGIPAFAAEKPQAFEPNVYVSIAPSGEITLIVHRSEMGTGIKTSLAMILADELEADWEAVQVVQAQGDKKYGDQNTDGSRSIRQFFMPLRQAGAAARQMLTTAAAQRWKVPADTCRSEAGFVAHAGSNRRLGYGALVAAAAKLPIPGPELLQLKTEAEWRYIGRSFPVVDLDNMVHGKAVYGIDMVVPGMKHASVEHPPVYGATLKSADSKAALAVPGVLQVIEIPTAAPPSGFRPLGGVAVIATNTWAALQGRQQLKLEWDLGPNAGYDTTEYRETLERSASQPGKVARTGGDVDAALQGAAKRISADYFVPHLGHAMMEPLAATAHFKNDAVEVWTATQNPQQARTTVAEVLGLPETAVTINITLLGGGFGRKSKPDYVAEAAFLSKAVGAPVKVTWSREDDLRNDYYHAICAQHMEGGLNAQGQTVAWLHRTAFPSISSTFQANVSYGAAGELGQGVTDMPYDIANVRCENGAAEAHVRIGWYRSVYNIPHGFALGSFVDELAAAAARDPVDYIIELLGTPRHVDLKAMGVDYPNYGASIDEYPIDTGRLAAVVKEVAKRSGWGAPLPPRQARGIAVHRSFLSYVAVVAQVAIQPDGSVSVVRIDMAVDPGRIVNPDRVIAQFEGAAVMGVSNTLFSALTFKNGQVEQTNFADYQVARIDAVPETHVHIMPSKAPPGGVGEPGVPPTSAAICNAIFRATGTRIRALPVDSSLLKQV